MTGNIGARRHRVRIVWIAGMCGYHFGQDSHRDKLATEENEQDAVVEACLVRQVDGVKRYQLMGEDSPNRQSGQPHDPQPQTEEPKRAQQVMRALSEACKQVDRNQIEETLDDPSDAVLRFTKLPLAMIDLDFANTPATAGGKDRNETMEFTVKLNFLHHATAVTFESTIVIVQPNSG